MSVAFQEFDYRITKEGRVRVFRAGRLVKQLGDKESRRFVGRISALPEDKIQIELARVTGNYRRGNERPEKKAPAR